MFGTALQLVGEVYIRRREHRIASSFLAGVEALVRRLLLVEAIQFVRNNPAPPPPAAPAPTRHKPSPHPASTPDHPPQSAELDTEDETQWKVRFSCGLGALLQKDPPAARPLPAPVRAPREELTPFCFAQTLAVRMEAVRRVISKPQPYVVLMATRLRRRLSVDDPPRPAQPGRLHPEAVRYLYWPLKRADAIAGDILAAPANPAPTPDTS